MAIKRLLLIVMSVSLAAGCTGLSEQQKKEFDSLQAQVADLRVAIDATNSRVEELDNKFGLLHEKIEPAEAPQAAAPATEPATGAMAEPEGLKVVHLEEKAVPEKKAPGPEKAAPVKKEVKKAAKPADKKTTDQSPGAMYKTGQDLFITGKYAEARKTFLWLVEAYPADDLADNALYWAGETYYTVKDFERALIAFREVAEKYPKGNKAPDALYKAALSHIELGDSKNAAEVLMDLVRRYPESGSAVKARKTLDNLATIQKKMSK